MEYRIGDFSQITRLTAKTLRYYHEIGLLEPCRVEASGYRWYDASAVRRVQIIQTLKNLDFSLEEITEILDRAADDDDLIEVARKRLAEIEGRLVRDRAIRNELVLLLNTHKGDAEMKTNDELVAWTDLKATPVASIRYQGRYDEIGQSYSRLFKLYGRFVAGPPLALYHDPEFRENDAAIEACLPLRPGSPAVSQDGAEVKLLPAQKVVQVVHRGSYDDLGTSYKKVFDFLSHEGKRPSLPSREVYLKGPGLILPRSPKKFVTLIQIPIEG